MESFDDFVKLFEKKRREKSDVDLTGVLKNGPSYLKNLSTNDIDSALSIFLDIKTGLLNFLADASNKNMESSIIEGFELLNFIVKQFYWLLSKYLNGIKEVCQSAIIRKCSHKVKSAAVDCFENLVKMCPGHELGLNEVVRILVGKFHLSNETERAKFFRALGVVAKYHPEAITSARSMEIFHRIMNDFDESHSKSKNSQSSVLAIYLDVLNNLLTNFRPQESHENSESYYKKLYGYIKDLSKVDINQKYKFVSRAAIELLGKHMSLFDDYVYKDAKFWHVTLLNWTKLQGDNRIVALETLSGYYERMGILLKNQNIKYSREIFEYLKQFFENEFTNVSAESISVQLSIGGYGHMAGPCKNYLAEKDVEQMFALLAQRAMIEYVNNNSDNEGSIESIAYYQVSLSQIMLEMSTISREKFDALVTLSLIFVKRFPNLPVTSYHHSFAVTSLLKTITNIRKVSRRSSEELIEKLVYEGIVWSCSHTLFVDAERDREMNNLNKRPLCYVNYLPLWQTMISQNKNRDVESSTISKEIFNNMIETCIKLMKKLNLNVTNVDIPSETESFDIPLAVNDTDFRIFVNLVDLFSSILGDAEPVLMEPHLNLFLRETIKKSHQNPLISGFYKLLNVVLKLCDSSGDSREYKLANDTLKLICQYLSDTIERLSSYSGELQNSCFNMIFEIPVFIARKMLNSLAFVFKTAFSLGQSNFGLALTALSRLEKLSEEMDKEEMTNFFIKVIPRLEPFLQSDETAVELSNEILPMGRTSSKNIFLKNSEKTLPEFQKRILLLFGSLNSEVILDIAGGTNSNNETLRDDKNLLKYTLLYRDIKPDIYLDKIFIRTIELALHSTDRRTRVVACEVLHSIIIIVLGRTVQFLSSSPDRMLPLFKKLCPAVLRLGSDSDQVIQQLFCPLTIGLTHWYSSKMMLRSSETVCLIDTLFELLAYESNMALIDFCGVCLAEFVEWSIKQSTNIELLTGDTNIKIILRKITNFAVHPSVQKRIGAAVAFNYLYTVLCEYDIIVDVYWLELLFCFVKSLDKCNSPEILKSLKHIERVIEIKYELLNRSSSSRRIKPIEFEGILLKDAADWLVTQCGSFDCNYRSKSMELLATISKSIPEFGTIQKVFSYYLNSNGIRGLNAIILKGLYPKMEKLTVETMNPLLKTLDCYIWILSENIISLDLMFTDKNANKDMIFNCIINFVYLVNVKSEEDDDDGLSKFKKQYRTVSVLKCEIILKIFDFVRILLYKVDTQDHTNSLSYIPTFFWNEELYSLISAALFKPDVIGFHSHNLKTMESLPSSMQNLLVTLIKNLDNEHISQLRNSIAKDVTWKQKEFSDLNTILNTDPSITLNNYLKGLTALETCDEFGKLYKRPLNDDDSVDKMMEIYNSLKQEQYGKIESVKLKTDVEEYLKNLLDFLYLRYNPNMVITLVNIVDTKIELIDENSTAILHGEYFMNLFGSPIYRCLLKHISKCLDTLFDSSLKNKCDTVLLLLEYLLVYVKKNKKICEEYLSTLETELVHRFATFLSLMNHVDKRKEKLINIYSLLVQVSRNPLKICREPNELYSWIMQELFSYLGLEYKTKILKNFLPCIVGETEHEKRELTRCLYKLKSDFYPVDINALKKGSFEHSNVIASFQTLTHHLPSLKSVVFFDCLIHITIDNIKYFWDNDSMKYLRVYFSQMTDANCKESLQVLYEYFVNGENFETRLQILRNLFLECIHFCNGNVIENFFEDNIKKIYDIALRDIQENDSAFKNCIVSKIGCYNLLEIMFAKVSFNKLCSAESKIVKNSIETIKTGKELFQALNCNVLGVRKLKIKSDDDRSKELIRLMHCAAYNCSIAIVSLKLEERFYVLLFAENKKDGQLIWENLIDKDKNYQFKQEFEKIPKEYKKLINIRKQCNLRKAHSYSYLKSYDLAASTLNEDLSCYDLYNSNLEAKPIGENNDGEEMMTLTFEFDDVNDHECMAAICGVITHMVSRNISRLPSNYNKSLPVPKWMEFFRNSLNLTAIYNVKLFMVKVILNMQAVFKPYGKSFITPILRFLNLHFESNRDKNCVIKDVIIMLIDWHCVAIPSDEYEKRLAQKFLELLMKNAVSDKSHIEKYNAATIATLVEAWQSCLEVPRNILSIRNASTKFTIRMILMFLFNKKEESVLRSEVLLYLTNSINDSDEKMVLDVCNGFGYILNYLVTKNNNEMKSRIIDDILPILVNDESQDNHNKRIKCIYEIHKRYPNIIDCCYQNLMFVFWKIDNSNKGKCLELFLSAFEKFTDEEIIRELGYIKFQDILKNKILTCENVALKMIEKLLNILNPTDYLPLALLTVPYSKDSAPSEQREIVIDIFIAVHRKYSDNIDDDSAVSELKDLSKRILLSGLLDPNESLQKKISLFWAENASIPEMSIERMLEIFNMYDVNLESSYLPILPLMMLHPVRKDPEFKKKMFEPLSECQFENYQVAIRWRSKHAALAAPLFTSSFATQMSQYYIQSNPKFSHLNQSFPRSPFSRRSQPLQFEQTLSEDQSSSQSLGSLIAGGFNDPTANFEKIPQPSKYKKSERLLQNTSLRDDIRRKQISKNLRREEILKEESDHRRESIKIYRKYRIGDFPDIEITHSSLIEPLEELVKNDQIIARELTVAIYSAMLKEMSDDQKKKFLEKLSSSLNVILENSQGSKPFLATVLEIIIHSEKINVSPNVIAKVSKSCGLFSLSALLLEEKIIFANLTEDNLEPASKMPKMSTQTSANKDDWLQLASIYKSMDDFDTVQNILGCGKFGKELQEASLAQAANKWSTARDAYEKAYEINEGLARDYCQESLFKCLAYMSDWKRIDDHIKQELKEDFNALWEKPLNENFMVSWILESQIHKIVRDSCDKRFSEALRNWISNKEKLTQLKRLYGEEIAVFYINQNEKFAQNCLRSGLEKIIHEWKHLNPFYYEQRINKYFKLRGFSDIKTYLRGVRDDENEPITNLKRMLTSWDKNVPENGDNLLLWDKHIAYRLYFFRLLIIQFSNGEFNEGRSEATDVLNEAIVRQCLNMARVGFSHRNVYFMKKYLLYSEPYFDDVDTKLKNEWKLSSAKCKYLFYKHFKGYEKRAKSFIDSLKMSNELVTDDNSDKKFQIDVKQHIGNLFIELQKMVIKSEPIGKMLLENQLIAEHLSSLDSRENILTELTVRCLDKLKECQELANDADKAGCYLNISKYCHSINSHFDEVVDLSKEFVHSTLRAMSYGSREASQYFPCLLNLEYSNDPELKATFECEIEKVETWMFIKWQAQLFSYIETPMCSLIASTLLRLAETYHESFVYTFRVTKAINKSLSNNPIVMKLSEILSEKKDLEPFLEALNNVVQPELYLKHCINEFLSNRAKGVEVAINTLLNSVYGSKISDDKNIPLRGKNYKIIDKYRDRIKDAESKTGGELFSHMKRIVKDLNESLENRIKNVREVPLEDYSPWLYNFSGGNIEVPGQYVGDVKPVPDYHAKIVKLNCRVTVLPSLWKPVKITIRGNDGKNYNFLLKFGEDLRLDERIEQLFMLMNKILEEDRVCRQRRLSVDTYLVIPLTGSLGLIQWVDNTRSLNEIFDLMLTDRQRMERKKIRDSHSNWINDSVTGESIETMYKKAVLRYGREDATERFDYFKTRLDWDVLRQAFKKLSSSPESFFELRQNFITSYASLCIAEWVLGIGDRNLTNTLVSYTSGKALGIDFGYSFDAAVDSSVPELMPFRLTPQIIGLLQPFDENGLLKITMINVLRALKHGQKPLLACMDIFIREPLLDWLARKKSTADRQEDPDAKWYPKQKIKIVIDKLNGVKPSKLTMLQMKDRYGDTEYFSKYIDIVNGSADGLQLRVRSSYKDDDLSVEEQVECLLDQATDPNILARTWSGWEPWL